MQAYKNTDVKCFVENRKLLPSKFPQNVPESTPILQFLSSHL